MDLLLAELEGGAAFAHALGLHAEHATIEFDAAVDIGDKTMFWMGMVRL
jgi:hypothetical protein